MDRAQQHRQPARTHQPCKYLADYLTSLPNRPMDAASAFSKPSEPPDGAKVIHMPVNNMLNLSHSPPRLRMDMVRNKPLVWIWKLWEKEQLKDLILNLEKKTCRPMWRKLKDSLNWLHSIVLSHLIHQFYWTLIALINPHIVHISRILPLLFKNCMTSYVSMISRWVNLIQFLLHLHPVDFVPFHLLLNRWSLHHIHIARVKSGHPDHYSGGHSGLH